jgi:hypothetical protein
MKSEFRFAPLCFNGEFLNPHPLDSNFANPKSPSPSGITLVSDPCFTDFRTAAHPLDWRIPTSPIRFDSQFRLFSDPGKSVTLASSENPQAVSAKKKDDDSVTKLVGYGVLALAMGLFGGALVIGLAAAAAAVSLAPENLGGPPQVA